MFSKIVILCCISANLAQNSLQFSEVLNVPNQRTLTFVPRRIPPKIRKWDKCLLTYKISDFPKEYHRSVIQGYLRIAFSTWASVTNLKFTEITNGMVDIRIKFSYHHGQTEHGHAIAPPVGVIHFSTDYISAQGNTLLKFSGVALHEIGHALGLWHVRGTASVMNPGVEFTYSQLQPIDVQNIQRLYGVKGGPKKCRKGKY